MSSLKDLSFSKRRAHINRIGVVLLSVYKLLKEKSKKNRLVDELSTSKKHFGKQKVIKFLNNNPDVADSLTQLISDSEGNFLPNEQAASNVLSNVNQYPNIFFIPFPEAPAREAVPAPASSQSVQFENIDQSIQANPTLPGRTEEQQQIAQSQSQSVSSNPLMQAIERADDAMKRVEQSVQTAQKIVADRQTQKAFDELNRNVSSAVASSSAGIAPRSESTLSGVEREQPQPNASGDPIQDIQHEAENAGSSQVQASENIDQGSGSIVNLSGFNRFARELTLSSETINELVRAAPSDMRPAVRQILNGNVTPDNVLRGIIHLGMLYGGVSESARRTIGSVLTIAQRNGLSLDKYLKKTGDNYNPTVKAVRELPSIARAFIEDYNAELSISFDTLKELNPEAYANLRDEDYEITMAELESALSEDIKDENDISQIPLGFNQFLNEMVGASSLYGRPSFTDEDIKNYLSGRKNMKDSLAEQRKTKTAEEMKAQAQAVIGERKEQPEEVVIDVQVPVGPEAGPEAGPGAAVGSGIIRGSIGAGTGIAAAAAARLAGVRMGPAVAAGVGGSIGAKVGEAITGATGVAGPAIGAALGGIAGGLLTREPVKMPPDTLKVIQQEDKGTGKLRPKFIIPSTDILQPSEQQIQADIDEWNIFDFVNPTSEGAEGTAADNPLKLQGLVEDEIRFRDAGMNVTQMYWDDLPYTNEQLIEYTIGAPLPMLPEMKFQDNEEEFFDSRGMPQLSLWKKNEGYNPDNQAHAIEIQSEFRNFTNVTQLDEDINNSILYGRIPMPFPKSGKY